jgi:hypothetical protein
MVRWLASPLGVLSGKVVLIRYTGRVSGLPRQLPVNAEPFEGGYLIRVGKFERKTWWLNFQVATTPRAAAGGWNGTPQAGCGASN